MFPHCGTIQDSGARNGGMLAIGGWQEEESGERAEEEDKKSAAPRHCFQAWRKEMSRHENKMKHKKKKISKKNR